MERDMYERRFLAMWNCPNYILRKKLKRQNGNNTKEEG